ncbi:hypothetical protein P9B01_02905 [Bacillus subtilis]|uniref:hypothetical protein n=1 Tax=Bacillus subtilis TaxID=1423 RepID=UPI002DB5967D|nr:hypothetical protein [Bacillus subtilis]MEC1007960.1 hypothetical protein [Bacillus subtilis]MEC1072818.1 hypothetical protein [Bacillus subtilis]
MTENNAKIHVLADETLGGIKREYVEVDRKAEVGEKVVIVNADVREEKPYSDGDIFDIENSGSSCVRTTCDRYLLNEEYHVLEPTDIVHIDGPNGTAQRHELTDRKAEVGEKIVHVDEDYGKSDGVVTKVTDVGTSTIDVVEYEVSDGEYVCGISHGYYRVLVPVESAEADEPQPADLIDVVANLAKEVAELKRENNERDDAIKKILSGMYDKTKRLENEIDTLHRDNRTLGEELARLKEPKETEEFAPIDAPLVFVQRKIGDVFDVYQDGKRLRGIKRIRIDAAMGEVTTHDIEFVSGATEEERP